MKNGMSKGKNTGVDGFAEAERLAVGGYALADFVTVFFVKYRRKNGDEIKHLMFFDKGKLRRPALEPGVLIAIEVALS